MIDENFEENYYITFYECYNPKLAKIITENQRVPSYKKI